MAIGAVWIGLGYVHATDESTKEIAADMAELEAAARHGSADAEFALGEVYRLDVGGTEGTAEAMKWYRFAAAQDQVEALVRLGDMLRESDSGVTTDFIESLRLARRAAELGSVEAMTDVGDMLRSGQGTARDYAEAAKCYQQAAAKGGARAMEMLGWMNYLGEIAAPPDFAAARMWFEKAGEKLSPNGMSALGHLYKEGKGGPKVPEAAFMWYERAARTGDANAQNTLGWMLREGVGIERDDEEAVTWFRLAAKNGSPMGDANLGFHYLHGRGVPKDVPTAVEHLLVAAKAIHNGWIAQTLAEALHAATKEERTQIRTLIQHYIDNPELMNAPGGLPETCVELLSSGPDWMRDRPTAKRLVERIIEAKRPQAHPMLAMFALYGELIPYDADMARREAEAARSTQPIDTNRLLALIDSVTATSDKARSDGEARLRQLAENGDRVAASLVSARFATGLIEPRDLTLARKYFLLASTSNADAAQAFEKFAKLASTNNQDDPTPERLALLIQKVTAKRDRSGTFYPEPVYRTPPTYPYELRMYDLEGEAKIDFVVDPEGVPQNVHAIKSTHPLFARAAESSVARWRFAPGWKNGKPVPVHFQVPIVFQLHDDAAPAQGDQAGIQ